MNHRCLALLLGWLAVTAAIAAEPELYVATNGNDRWSGRLATPNATGTDGPLATLSAVQQRVRLLRRQRPDRPVTVAVRGGTYRLSQPWIFTPQDSGQPGAPVTYLAYQNEQPVISGGRKLTGFRHEGAAWVLDLPEVKDGTWWFNQLFVNGERRRRARLPNDGFFQVESYDASTTDGHARPNTAFVYHQGDLEPWPDLADATVVVYHSWETSLLRVKRLEPDRHMVEFTGRANWRFGYWGPGQRYEIQNVRAGLDQPGEWYLDRAAGQLRYLPLAGEDPTQAEVIAPVTEELVSFRGDSELGLPVQDIVLRGLSFQHAAWQLEPQGHSDAQAVSSLSAAIVGTGALRCVLQDCELAHVGRYGVWLRKGCQQWTIQHCQLRDVGAGGIRIGETSLPFNPSDAVDGNTVDNCYIHDFGEVYAAGVGIYIAQGSDNRITHNEIHDGYYSGMSIGWNWGTTPTAAHRNLIEHNHIHHVLRGLLSDGAGIYTLGNSPGSVIRGNLIHDVFSYKQPLIAWGIYLDAHSNQLTVEHNLCYNLQNGGLMMHNGAHRNVVRQNIFARSQNELVWRSPGSVTVPNTFTQNICWLTQGQLFLFDANPDELSTWDGNLYWRTDDEPLDFMDETLPEWRERGLDQHSVVADPKFVDPEHDNFRLQPDSPALTKLGFEPHDFTQAGLYGDPAWVKLPQQRTWPQTVLPEPNTRRARRYFSESFDDVAVGARVPNLYTYPGKIAGGKAQVTAGQAASGQHSLELVDAPGLEHEWDPHCYYHLSLRRDRVKVSFKVRYEPGALPWIEARDGHVPYLPGPSLKLQNGRLLANGKDLAAAPPNQWLAFEFTMGLGDAATGTYDLALQVGDAAPQTWHEVACAKDLKSLTWLGFVSLATDVSRWYIDDMTVSKAE